MLSTTRKIKNKAFDIGFDKIGIANPHIIYEDNAIYNLQNWLSLGYQADMAWMNNPKRFDITQCMPDIRSVITVALNYYTPHKHSNNINYGKVSRYAWGKDYHKVLKQKLKLFCKWLTKKNIKTVCYVDTGPIQEKVWAERSGIGWIAKNGNIITKEFGSWVFLGVVLTNLSLISDTPHVKHCGACRRCIDICPTKAIVSPFVVDSRRCIAYHTIENKSENLPEYIVNNLNGWVAGCDLCQDVCPWNQRFSQETNIQDFYPYPGNISLHLEEISNLTEIQWQQKFSSSSLKRIKAKAWRRNADANL
ncbi:tRNA epoxyqueuosine(34) reductase QueG [Candidatus Atelocyanobacterium thalassae]|uniref:Epoxyqueuosine reductase n=1 Tax=cyanobacterium endosymbiont of Braarudosphaera bigelowii TaxID=1285375 RepID=A0ABN6K0X8_9CHRO|nr:tRNA epoxyqueuosine(34) reductase QueG [Candidatus Atelocyanobacterium thalassa]BDA39828.1 epoxyqueuosine reductase [cyanobacterium endosymbiont of Braarudosphaera bigelowii]